MSLTPWYTISNLSANKDTGFVVFDNIVGYSAINARVAQWQSASLTSTRSLVRFHSRAPKKSVQFILFGYTENRVGEC